MARPVNPDLPPPQAPSLLPAELLPELQAQIELANRNLAIMERRVAAWESELKAVSTELRARVKPTGEEVDPNRYTDLEARLGRLERRWNRRNAMNVAAAAALAAGPVSAVEDGMVPDGDIQAIVFARWSSTQVDAGEAVKLSAMVDGFPEDTAITFTLFGLDGTRPCEPVVVTTGEADTVQMRWTAPALGKRDHAEYYFEASSDHCVARSPVLTVVKA